MTSGTSDWHELRSTAETVAQVSDQIEQRSGQQQLSAEERLQVREALQLVTVTGKRLSQQLDRLAQRCGSGPRSEPADSQVALDQAAAAADDLGTCAKAAAQALADDQ